MNEDTNTPQENEARDQGEEAVTQTHDDLATGETAEDSLQNRDHKADAGIAPPTDLSVLHAQIADLEDRLKRSYAEQQNQRQRMIKERAAHERYAGSKLATDLLDVMDNLERAINSVPIALADNAHVSNLIEGVRMVSEQFEQVFATHEIVKITPMGELINYDLHETVAEADDNPIPANHVIDVLQSGYMMKDRLLRPAKVVLSSGRKSSPKENDSHLDEEA